MKSKLSLIVSVFILLFSTIEAASQDNNSVSGIVSCFKQIPLNKVKVTAVKTIHPTLMTL